MIFVKNPLSVLALIFLGKSVVIELNAVSTICLLLLIERSSLIERTLFFALFPRFANNMMFCSKSMSSKSKQLYRINFKNWNFDKELP